MNARARNAWRAARPDEASAGARAPDRLREVRQVRQRAGENRRRWFASHDADLYVWHDGARVTRFELCYDKPHDEHALSWTAGKGFGHMRVDDGEANPGKNLTPIAVPDGCFDLVDIALEFERLAAGIDPRIYRFVLGRLHDAR